MHRNRAIDAFVKCGVTIICAKNAAKRGVKKIRGNNIQHIRAADERYDYIIVFLHSASGKKLRVRKLCMASLQIKLHDAVECQNGNSWLQV